MNTKDLRTKDNFSVRLRFFNFIACPAIIFIAAVPDTELANLKGNEICRCETENGMPLKKLMRDIPAMTMEEVMKKHILL